MRQAKTANSVHFIATAMQFDVRLLSVIDHSFYSKDLSTPTTMSKQHVERYKSNDSFDKVECCFDNVAGFGNNV